MNAARLAAARAAPALRARAVLHRPRDHGAARGEHAQQNLEYAPYVQNLHLHGADNPTYLKGDGDKTRSVGFALLGFALLQVRRPRCQTARQGASPRVVDAVSPLGGEGGGHASSAAYRAGRAGRRWLDPRLPQARGSWNNWLRIAAKAFAERE